MYLLTAKWRFFCIFFWYTTFVDIYPSLNIYLAKSNIPNAGRGVFAVTKIAKGTVIEVCPVIVIPQHQAHIIQQTMLINYNFAWGKGKETVALCLGFGSVYNHSYTPNATYKKQFDHASITFIAMQDIKKDEEITVNYNSGSLHDRTTLWMKDVPAFDETKV